LVDSHACRWELRDLIVSSSAKDAGKKLMSTATVTLWDVRKQEEKMIAALGIGPVDATFKAIVSLIEQPVQLTKYVVTKIEGGSVRCTAQTLDLLDDFCAHSSCVRSLV
jgi:hypothetical protein